MKFPQSDEQLTAARASGWLIIQGDGRNISRHTSNSCWHVASKYDEALLMGPNAHHPFCIIDGPEDYLSFRDSLHDMLCEINELQGTTIEIHLNDEPTLVPVNFALSGDNKFLHIVQGISKANARYFCTYCYCTKSELRSTLIAGQKLERRYSLTSSDEKKESPGVLLPSQKEWLALNKTDLQSAYLSLGFNDKQSTKLGYAQAITLGQKQLAQSGVDLWAHLQRGNSNGVTATTGGNIVATFDESFYR